MCFSGGQTPFSPFPAMQEGTSYFFFSLFIKIIQIIPVILFIINFIFYRYIILNIFSSLAGIQFVMKSLLVTCIEVIQFWIISVLYHCLSFCLLSYWIFMIYISCAQYYKNNHHDQSSSNDNKCHSSGQSSIPFSTFPTEGKLRDKVFDIGFSGFFKLSNFVIEVNWLIIALIDSCDWGWLG